MSNIKSRNTQSNMNQMPNQIDIMGPMFADIDNNKNKVEVISSKYHTLFIEKDKLPADKIVIPTEVLAEMAAASGAEDFDVKQFGDEIQIEGPDKEYTKFSFYLGDIMHGSDEKENYFKLLKAFDTAKEDDVCRVYISSYGGSINEGDQIINHIKTNFSTENIITVLDPMGYSMASSVFLIGGTRVVSDTSSIMLHNYSMGVFGKGGEIKDMIEFNDDLLNDRAYHDYVIPGYITEEEFNQYKIGKEWWFNAEEMLDRGIATHYLTSNQELISAKEYFEMKSLIEDKPKKKTTSKKKTTKKPKKK